MDASVLWQIFLETGAPEMYLLYHAVVKAEEKHVSNDPGYCPASYRLQ